MPPNPDKQRCTARTKTGARCRQWVIKNSAALHGPPVCSTHAGRRGHRLPNDEEDAAGRRCTATTVTGERCRRWAVHGREGGPPLCYTHLLLNRQGWPEEVERQRCTATAAATGKRCRNWAMRDSAEEHGRPLCYAHTGRFAETRRIPGERRCTAMTRHGARCRQWATRQTVENPDVEPLCAIHAAYGSGDARHVRRRCAATVDAGTGGRCRRWALKGETLCWIHAYPEQHGAIRHGFYRNRSPLSAEEQEAVALTWNRGNELGAAILIARLQIRALLDYLAQTERPLVENLNAMRLLLKSCRRVSRLVAAARKAGSTSESDRVPITVSEAAWLENILPELEWQDAHE